MSTGSSSWALSPGSKVNRHEFKAAVTAAEICQYIEKSGDLDDLLSLQGVLQSSNAGDILNIKVLPYEIIIEVPSEALAVRYFDPAKANVITPYSDISKLSTKIITPRLTRQVISRTKALLAQSDGKRSSLDRVGPNDTGSGAGVLSVELDRAIVEAAKVLSSQDSNVIFEKNARLGQWCFRKSSILIETPQLLRDELQKKLERQGQTRFLLSLRRNSSQQIEGALRRIFNYDDESIEEALKGSGINCVYEFKKVLLVAPYGDTYGKPLKTIAPHLGVEKLSYVLNRELADVDARVYNPNLGSKTGLFEFIDSEGSFDLVGFSLMQVVIGATLEMLCETRTKYPNSLLVIGGSDIDKLPRDFFHSSPHDVAVRGDGTAIIDIVKRMSADKTKKKELSGLKNIPNLMITEQEGEKEKVIVTEETFLSLPRERYPDFTKDIPFDKPDLTHGKAYQGGVVGDVSRSPVYMDKIGRRALRVTLGDFCSGRCVFCNAQRNAHRHPPVDKVMEYIKNNFAGNDSILLSSVDFLFDMRYAERLCEALKNSEFRDVPKLVVARVNNIDRRILGLFKEAGITVVAQGCESFDDLILEMIGKRTTRKQNLTALDLEIEAGIRPGIYIMFFTPWSTTATALDTVDICTDYALKGAYINLAADIDVHHGTSLSKMGDLVEYENIDFPGMKKPLKHPTMAKVLDEDLRSIRERTMEILEKVTSDTNIPPRHLNSLPIHSLIFLKAFCVAYAEKHKDDLSSSARIQKIDMAIKRALDEEMRTVEGALTEFNPDAYFNKCVIPGKNESSLNLDSYVTGRFPAELLSAINDEITKIEIHRGPQSCTEQYLDNMRWRGYKVTKLWGDRDFQWKIYSLTRGEENIFVISNILGPSRELAVAQSLTYLRCPQNNIRIRQFDVNPKELWAKHLSDTAGKIGRAIIAHDIKDFSDVMIRVEPGAKVIRRVEDEGIFCLVVERPNGERVLIFDLNYAYGERITDVVNYMISDVSKGGLGIKEINLSSACGAIGKGIELNDVVLFSRPHRYGREIFFGKDNVDAAELKKLLPNDIHIHQLPVFTVPSIMSESLSLSRVINLSGGGAIELELGHLCELLADNPEVDFRAFFEVHDKPSLGEERANALGRDIPGFRNFGKIAQTREAINSYIFGIKAEHRSEAYIAVKRGKIIRARDECKISKKESDDAEFLLDDIEYGDAARGAVCEFVKRGDWDGLRAFVRVVAGRRHAIDLVYDMLDPAKEYKGYDVIIVSSKTENEAAEKQKELDGIFSGVKTASGKPVRIISVSEEDWTQEKKIDADKKPGAGNFLANPAAYIEACKKMPELDELWREGRVKIMMVHDAGDATRGSPNSLAYGSRGSQSMIGSVGLQNSNEFPLTLLNLNILLNLQHALSNNGSSLDVFWSSEMIIGSTPAGDIDPIGGALFSAMGMELTKRDKIGPEDLKRNGFFYRRSGEKSIGFAAQSTFADNPEKFEKLRKGSELLVQDTSGQRFSRVFFSDMIGLFGTAIDKKAMKVDHSPQIIHPIFIVIEGMSKYKGDLDLTNAKVEDVEKALSQVIDEDGMDYLSKLKELRSIKDKPGLPDKDGNYRQGEFYKAIIELYILSMRHCGGNAEKFLRLSSVGAREDAYYWTYRSALEQLNADLEMTTDLSGKKTRIGPDGNAVYEEPTIFDRIKAEDARRLRRIKVPVNNVTINGKTYSFTREEIRRGIDVGGVRIKGSIVQNCVLSGGTDISNSVVTGVEGEIVAEASEVSNSKDPLITATASNVSNVILPESIRAASEVLTGIFRVGLEDPRTGVPGETIFDAPINFDAKTTDQERLPGNWASARELRAMPKEGSDIAREREMRTVTGDTRTGRSRQAPSPSHSTAISGEDNDKSGKKTRAYENLINSNRKFLAGSFKENEPIMLRVPVEMIEEAGAGNAVDILSGFQQSPGSNRYVELYYMTGTGEVNEAVYQRFGLSKRSPPKGFKMTRENTVTLFSAFKGEKIDQSCIVSRLGSCDVKPENTILSPAGSQHDPAGLIRAMILGLKMMDVARQIKEKGHDITKDQNFRDMIQLEILEQLKDVCDAADFKDFNLTPDDIIALADGTINNIVTALGKLVKLLPIAPIDKEDLRRINEQAKTVFTAA